MRRDTLVVLPTYNEADNLREMVAALTAAGAGVLVVDDGSPDGTGDIADELAEGSDQVSVMHRTTKEGLGPAYAAGFRRALATGSAVICQMDADFSHDPADVARLVDAIEAGADMAIGSRYVAGGGIAGWPWHRRLLSRLGNLYAKTALGTSINDMTAGFRAFRPDALSALDPSTCEAAGYGFQIEMAWRASRAGLAVVEVPVTFTDRRRGESKMTTTIALEALGLVTRWGMLRLRSQLPWRTRRSRADRGGSR